MVRMACVLFAALMATSLCVQAQKELKPKTTKEGLELNYFDKSIKPQDDFFKYVNGGWIDKTSIPSDQGRWAAFSELSENNLAIVLQLLQKAANNPKYKEGSDERKAADFYAVAMDSMLAEKKGLAPLKPTLDAIQAIRTKDDLQRYLLTQQLTGGGAFFSFGVEADEKNTSKMAAYIGTDGIGLPERDYYLKDDAKSKEIRQHYVKFLAKDLTLAGDDSLIARKSAETVLKLETDLASSMLSKEDRRDPVKTYNKMSVRQLSDIVSFVNWPSYFNGLGVHEDSVIVTQPAFLKKIQEIVTNYNLEDVKTYLRATAVRDAAFFLNHDFVQESFQFYSKYMRGVDRLRPRWKRVMYSEDQYMGEAIGKLYVEEVFPPEAKKKALEMVNSIKEAFGERIKNLDWMSDSTKQMALKKLSTFTVKIGYPDTWRGFADLTVEKDKSKASYYLNKQNAAHFELMRQVAKLGKPVDRSEWVMSPQTVNAYYNPVFNEIVFPAGILQPPFYNYKVDDAVNFGGIGAVIGHEISHGFDDQGSQFDADGNLKNWWSPKDLERFKAKGAALADQFDKYEPLKGVFVQGKFTLGENIGDLGGLTASYYGLENYLKKHGNPGKIDGLTPEQRFFISWATIWRIKYKDETLRTQVLTDPHSPGMYRANGPLSNFTPFYEAFGIKEGDKMYRKEADRVKIW